MNDKIIIDWLKNNTVSSKEKIYEQFPNINTDVIDYHINAICPELLDNVDKKEENITPAKKNKIRGKIIDYVISNPEITTKKLYKVFPDVLEVTLRQYKSQALTKIKKLAEAALQEEEKERIKKEKEALENCKKIVNDNRQNKTDKGYVNDLSPDNQEILRRWKAENGGSEDDNIKEENEKELILSELEKKAYGSQKADIGVNNPDVIGLTNEKTLDDNLKNLIEKLLNDIIEKKMEEITRSIDKRIEEKINAFITKKISELGTNIISKTLGNVLGNMNLNTILGNK